MLKFYNFANLFGRPGGHGGFLYYLCAVSRRPQVKGRPMSATRVSKPLFSVLLTFY